MFLRFYFFIKRDYKLFILPSLFLVYRIVQCYTVSVRFLLNSKLPTVQRRLQRLGSAHVVEKVLKLNGDWRRHGHVTCPWLKRCIIDVLFLSHLVPLSLIENIWNTKNSAAASETLCLLILAPKSASDFGHVVVALFRDVRQLYLHNDTRLNSTQLDVELSRYVQYSTGFNPFNAGCSKSLLFEGSAPYHSIHN